MPPMMTNAVHYLPLPMPGWLLFYILTLWTWTIGRTFHSIFLEKTCDNASFSYFSFEIIWPCKYFKWRSDIDVKYICLPWGYVKVLHARTHAACHPDMYLYLQNWILNNYIFCRRTKKMPSPVDYKCWLFAIYCFGRTYF